MFALAIGIIIIIIIKMLLHNAFFLIGSAIINRDQIIDQG